MFLNHFLFFFSCSSDSLNKPSGIKYKIQGTWVESETDMGKKEFEVGLGWLLGGIALQPSDWELQIFPSDRPFMHEILIEINQGALQNTECVERIIKDLPVDQNIAVPLAFLTQHPRHVSLILDQSTTLEEWESEFKTPDTTLILDSLVLEQSREVHFNSGASSLVKVAFKAQVLGGESGHTETIDVLPNGRMRFGLYDSSSELVPSSELGSVGQCQWCHEGKLLDLQEQPDTIGYSPYQTFTETIVIQNDLIVEQHDAIYSGGLLLDLEVHGYGERIFEAYLHPSLNYLSREFDWSEQQVSSWLSENEINGEAHLEYPSWGSTYQRSAILSANGEDLTMPMNTRSWPIDDWPSLCDDLE